jgi:hypothetical protein
VVARARADDGSLRCGNRLIQRGASVPEVLATCGPPAFQLARYDTLSRAISPGTYLHQTVLVEQWTYDPGPRAFIRTLTFRDGTLDAVALLGYGTGR